MVEALALQRAQWRMLSLVATLKLNHINFSRPILGSGAVLLW